MREWWINLSLREKQVVALGTLALGLFLFYAIFWAPLSNKVDTLREKIIRDQKLLVWMQDADKRIQELEKTQHPAKRSSESSILNIVQEEINKSSFGKNVTQLQLADNDSVQLHLQKVGFDNFIKWLTMVSQQQQLTITQMSIKSAGGPGLVDVDLKLS